jgi:hypothetical protein
MTYIKQPHMKQTLLYSVLAASLFISCKKDRIEAQGPQPVPASGEVSRSLQFPNQNDLVKFAHYKGNSLLQMRATVTDGKLSLIMDASPATNNSGGDAIAFTIDAKHFGTGLVGSYDYVNTNARILSTRYTYTFKNGPGDIWGSMLDLNTGLKYTGILHILQYDAAKKLISGSFDVYVKDLINDPTKRSTASPIDLADYCHLNVSGNFTNLKVE